MMLSYTGIAQSKLVNEDDLMCYTGFFTITRKCPIIWNSFWFIIKYANDQP